MYIMYIINIERVYQTLMMHLIGCHTGIQEVCLTANNDFIVKYSPIKEN